MPQRYVSRLRRLVAVIGFMASTLAGADNATSLPAPVDPAVHVTPHGDTPHDSFASAEIGKPPSGTA